MGVDLFEALVGDAWRDVGGLSPAALASQLGFLVIVTLGLVESGWLAWHRRDRERGHLLSEVATAAVMGIGGLIVGVALASLFVVEFNLIGALTATALPGLWEAHPIVGFVTAFIAWDLVGHLYHRVGHSTAIGWAAHRPHHTGTEFNLSLAWRQSWLPVHAVVLPVVAIGGWSLSTIVICAAISNVLQAVQHSSAIVRVPRGLEAIVMTPVQHRRHHQLQDGAEHRPVNLGPVLTFWDRLAGTYNAEPISATARYGVDSATTNPLRLQFEGWSELGLKSRSSNLSLLGDACVVDRSDGRFVGCSNGSVEFCLGRLESARQDQCRIAQIDDADPTASDVPSV